MKKIINNCMKALELRRYKMLSKDSFAATIYREFIYLIYPIINTKFVLNSKLLNRRNRESDSLYIMIEKASKGDKSIKKDLILSYLYYHIVPWEYKLYCFKSQTHLQRLEWLSDADRYMCCELVMGIEPYMCLKDKYTFYQMLRTFYKRPMFIFSKDTTFEQLSSFLTCQDEFFIKPVDGSLGRDTFIVRSTDDKKILFKRLLDSNGKWLIEGAIVQSEETAIWNRSSVNTIRIPSIRNNYKWQILQPFFRTGREGQIVDNAGAGGILCVVDENTGIVVSDGYDEKNNLYIQHPDSNVIYKGWQVPRWQELMSIVENVHKSLPEIYKYVGFDFALTNDGWDLIEGNWGQFVGQIAAKKGIKKQFDKYIGL